MQIIAPDLLTDMRELPTVARIVVTLIGMTLWSTGWWAHRFWTVLFCTVGAGLFGLRLGPEFGLQPIVAGLLAAVAAGGLALSLARVAVFAACGLGCWLAAKTLVPNLAEPLVCILGGGLVGVLLFRFCIMFLTSAVGALLVGYGGLILAEKVAKFDAVAWVTKHSQWLNIGFAAAIVLGMAAQYFVQRFIGRFKRWKQERADWKKQQAEDATAKKNWMSFLRKAG